ncbi:MAG: MBL fold metallo-hydrolase [candidate division Zixibacteria bacterium]|nr:MBL fold metallo-hydrolase [candidate division Zixibacteria bacterium]
MKITIIYDNETSDDALTPDWGFSCLIEAYDRRILFDTGGSGAILLKNMGVLGIDPHSIGEVFISHIHFDHTGGLSAFLDVNENVTLYAPSSLRGVFHVREIVYEDKPTQLHEYFYTTGLLEDMEQSLAIQTEKGLVVVVGCSHPGVGNILKAAAQFGKPYMLIGGLHGFNEFGLIKDLHSVCPTHCTQHIPEIKSLYPDMYIQGGVGTVIKI